MPDKKEQLTLELGRAVRALAARISPQDSEAAREEILDLAAAIVKIALWPLSGDRDDA